MNRSFDIVIVGGGQAARRAAEGARKVSSEVSIAIFGEELYLPYDRPALSKAVLKDFANIMDCEKRSAGWYEDNHIEIVLGMRVVSIDPIARTIMMADGTCIGWNSLVLATGSRPRSLDLDIPSNKVHMIRTRNDARRLSETLLPGRRIGIVGAGFIGLEVAATAKECGAEVEIFEAAPSVLARVLPKFLAKTVECRHRKADVRIHLNTTVSGAELEAFDEIVVGIGVVPNVELATACGVFCDNGIVVDVEGRTNLTDIYAAGEVTRHPGGFGFGAMRRESWQVAEIQAFAAGATAAGTPMCYDEIPWFWSDQYDLNLQVLGEPGDDAEWVTRGDVEENNFSAFALNRGGVRCVVSFNRGRDIAAGRRLIRQGLKPPVGKLTDDSLSWKDILKSAV